MIEKEPIEFEEPPLLGSWKNMYIAVLIIHGCVIALFTFLTYIYR